MAGYSIEAVNADITKRLSDEGKDNFQLNHDSVRGIAINTLKTTRFTILPPSAIDLLATTHRGTNQSAINARIQCGKGFMADFMDLTELLLGSLFDNSLIDGIRDLFDGIDFQIGFPNFDFDFDWPVGGGWNLDGLFDFGDWLNLDGFRLGGCDSVPRDRAGGDTPEERANADNLLSVQAGEDEKFTTPYGKKAWSSGGGAGPTKTYGKTIVKTKYNERGNPFYEAFKRGEAALVPAYDGQDESNAARAFHTEVPRSNTQEFLGESTYPFNSEPGILGTVDPATGLYHQYQGQIAETKVDDDGYYRKDGQFGTVNRDTGQLWTGLEANVPSIETEKGKIEVSNPWRFKKSTFRDAHGETDPQRLHYLNKNMYDENMVKFNQEGQPYLSEARSVYFEDGSIIPDLANLSPENLGSSAAHDTTTYQHRKQFVDTDANLLDENYYGRPVTDLHEYTPSSTIENYIVPKNLKAEAEWEQNFTLNNREKAIDRILRGESGTGKDNPNRAYMSFPEGNMTSAQYNQLSNTSESNKKKILNNITDPNIEVDNISQSIDRQFEILETENYNQKNNVKKPVLIKKPTLKEIYENPDVLNVYEPILPSTVDNMPSKIIQKEYVVKPTISRETALHNAKMIKHALKVRQSGVDKSGKLLNTKQKEYIDNYVKEKYNEIQLYEESVGEEVTDINIEVHIND